ncbi:LytR/AlgR family response regulator transcription factor [Weizmannia sp. FSL W8-0401]|uniref:LytR/AlgR family response regulator transcription factor n=1 Tax=Weizmannia sp. FSL W8-0401 TaxID=2954554 RepID=UPI0030F921BA
MKAIIVEDEIPAREELAYLIETYSGIEITDCFEDGLDVLKFLQEHETDAIFLDINIPFLDGMLLAGSISKFAHKPYIIFTTAYKEHAVQAFELEAFDYILKPYEEKRIAAMLKRLEAAYKREHPLPGEEGAVPRNGGLHRKERVNLRKGEKIIVADANDIFYCAAQEKITLVYTQQETFEMPMAISEFQSLLPEDLFFRCHRSYLVNLTKIREIVPWFNQTYLLRLKGMDAEIPVSRRNVKQFKALMHF